jgi:GDP/UDP-N,N'-diacetylbacillosamine 2-epimerase (hydrolysing)
MSNMTRRKICVVTATRAEYGLLTPLMKRIRDDAELELQIIVTGMHLSPEFGLTYKAVEEEFFINKKIEMLLSSDTPVAISKSMGLAQISFVEAYDQLMPDIIIVLGDRYELIPIVSSAMIMNIPIAHISGGEITEGAQDDAIRHSITKMSHLHFTATEIYRKRVIQLGEQPERVFAVGEAGLDNIFDLTLLTKEAFEKSIGFSLNKKNILVTFHPVTLEQGNAKAQCQALLDAIDTLKETHIIFTKANSDADGRLINTMLEDYVQQHSNKAVLFTSLGQLRYLSALQFVDAVVGNSSSGLVEAPSFKIGTINIGNRQKGRIKAKSVIDCTIEADAICKAFDTLYSKTFQKQLKDLKNPYGNGDSSIKIKNILKSFPLEGLSVKIFYDVDFNA